MFAKALETLRGLTRKRGAKMTSDAIRRSPVKVGINLSTGTRWPHPKPRPRTSNDRNLRPTAHRRAWGGFDHQAPQGGVDDGGHPWRGTSRIRDRRRHAAKSNDATWRAFYRETSKARWQLQRLQAMSHEELLAYATKRQWTHDELHTHDGFKLTEEELRQRLIVRYVAVGAL